MKTLVLVQSMVICVLGVSLFTALTWKADHQTFIPDGYFAITEDVPPEGYSLERRLHLVDAAAAHFKRALSADPAKFAEDCERIWNLYDRLERPIFVPDVEMAIDMMYVATMNRGQVLLHLHKPNPFDTVVPALEPKKHFIR